MDRIDKALAKLTPKERKLLSTLLDRVEQGDFVGLDLKKLAGSQATFRVRKGDMRIIFTNDEGAIRILALERRTDTTYRK